MARFKALVLLLLSMAGCAPTTRHFSRAMTEGVVEGAADAVAKNPDAQRKIANGLDQEAIEEGVKRSAGGVIDGTLDTLDDQQRRERLTKEIAAITSTLTTTLIQSAGSAALSDANQQKVAAMTAGLIRLVKAEVLPDEATVQKMMLVVRQLVKNMTLGFQDAIDETQAKRNSGELGPGQGSVLWATGQAAESGNEMFYMMGAGALALALIGVGIGIWAWRSSKAHKAELAERDEAMLLLAEAIKSTETQPWSGELRDALRDKMRSNQSSEYVRRMLRGKPELRMKEPRRSMPPSAPGSGLRRPERLSHA